MIFFFSVKYIFEIIEKQAFTMTSATLAIIIGFLIIIPNIDFEKKKGLLCA